MAGTLNDLFQNGRVECGPEQYFANARVVFE
jgi:hypothetical protein